MDKTTRQEKMDKEKLAKRFGEQLRKKNNELKSTYSTDIQNLLYEVEKYNGDVTTTEVGKRFVKYLKNEKKDPVALFKKEKKPSDFWKKEMKNMPGWIAKELLEDFYVSMDSVTGWQNSDSVFRRSMRSSKYEDYIEKIFKILDAYHKASAFGTDIVSVYRGDISKGVKAYWERNTWAIDIPDVWIAAELDRGNKELEEVLGDIISGDGNQNTVTQKMIRGIVMSRNERMYEQLGKLLVAARLQEGLRQAICESMDCGRVEAFQYLFKIIIEHNLIRYSSVMRAVGTWTGLLTIEERDINRFSNKQLALIDLYLENEKEREKGLKGEDSMEIYLALWSYGFWDIYLALDALMPLLENGTKHQRMVGCFYLRSVELSSVKQTAAKMVVKNFSGELDTMALVMPCFMSNCGYYVRNLEHGQNRLAAYKKTDKRLYIELEQYFDSKEECEEIYNILLRLLDSITKKKLTFSPCVFPWNWEELSKSDVVTRLCICASALRDNAMIDEAAALIPSLDTGYYGYRKDMLWLLLKAPETDLQRRLLTAAVADSETQTRQVAYELVSEIALEPENYSQLEEMLKYKKTDVRGNVLKLLYALDGEDMRLLIERLLSDKKEEKRTAGLDLLLQLKRDEDRQELFEKCQPLVTEMKSGSTKETILIEELAAPSEQQKTGENGYGLYDVEAEYVPQFNKEYLENCKKVFLDCFPSSVLNQSDKSGVEALEDSAKDREILCKLDDLIEENKLLEYTSWSGDTCLLMNPFSPFRREDGTSGWPFEEMWEEFYQKEIGSYKECFRLAMWLENRVMEYRERRDFLRNYEGLIADLFGKHFTLEAELNYPQQISDIIKYLEGRHRQKELLEKLSVVVADYLLHMEEPLFCEILHDKKPWEPEEMGRTVRRSIVTHEQLKSILAALGYAKTEADFKQSFPYYYALAEKTDFDFMGAGKNNSYVGYYIVNANGALQIPDVCTYIAAYQYGLISKDFLYKALFHNTLVPDVIEKLSYIIQYQKDRKRQLARRDRERSWIEKQRLDAIAKLLGHKVQTELSKQDEQMLQTAEEVYQNISSLLMETELKRGDSETVFSGYVYYLKRVYGVDYFVRILSALGKETLERSTWFDSTGYYSRRTQISKRNSLCHLLLVCVPEEEETAEQLAERLKDTDITEKRLIEAGLYSPEWLEIIGDYLGWDGFLSGCYYFMAHMNEQYDDKRTAIIAKYTPLSTEELNNGAFDINWFKEAYDALGEKRFSLIYKAAKYISDGSKHARARKYADAVTGVYEKEALRQEIAAKRNKDLLMAYGLIPLKGDKDLTDRYLYLQQFAKESKQFGAQRRASEKIAVQNALRNLALNAGYPDETRLILKMESRIAKDLQPLFEPAEVEDVTVWLQMGETGKGEVICEKGGKRLKSVPAKLKKQEYIVTLNESKKRLTEQYRRTKVMLEEAMEEETEFTVEEVQDMLVNPVIASMVEKLVFLVGEQLGFMTEKGLADYNGALTEIDKTEAVRVAHPYHLYKAGQWHEYQKLLFEKEMKQPFKQVFRELYVKTPEEMEGLRSLRYAGNQIQPKRTVACLKGRRWVADVESGLQKVYYRENIVARIYALADWFSPADIESPTLEWVVFSDRKTFQEIRIKDVPDILFSEVMRDVDLAVSVAHAGGVDPETSHSTIEMRRAIAEFTLPLFKLDNVTFTKSHAVITGERGNYTVHLGSGVIHQDGGPMIQVLPVHSQHRGRLFLPFVDDDPKTAEVLSKILLFAEDKKIKDPFILDQIVK